MVTQQSVNQLAYQVVGCAIEVHRQLGPGLLESIYEDCLIMEMKQKGLSVLSQIEVPVTYKGLELRQRLRLDLLVNDLIIVEIKAIEHLLPVHKAQLLTYMKLTSKPKGLLINFFTDNITQSVIPLVNEHFAALPIS